MISYSSYMEGWGMAKSSVKIKKNAKVKKKNIERELFGDNILKEIVDKKLTRISKKSRKLWGEIEDEIMMFTRKNSDQYFNYPFFDNFLIFKKVENEVNITFNKSIFTPLTKTKNKTFIVPILVCLPGLGIDDEELMLSNFGVITICINEPSEVEWKFNQIN